MLLPFLFLWGSPDKLCLQSFVCVCVWHWAAGKGSVAAVRLPSLGLTPHWAAISLGPWFQKPHHGLCSSLVGSGEE